MLSELQLALRYLVNGFKKQQGYRYEKYKITENIVVLDKR
jgi:hypothetical protein